VEVHPWRRLPLPPQQGRLLRRHWERHAAALPVSARALGPSLHPPLRTVLHCSVSLSLCHCVTVSLCDLVVSLYCRSIFIFLLALVGVFYPYNRGALYTALVVIYALTSGIAGYAAASMYKQMEGTNWVSAGDCTVICFFFFFSSYSTNEPVGYAAASMYKQIRGYQGPL